MMYCKACGNSDQSQFHIYPHRTPVCIPCARRRGREYYASHREQRIAYGTEYYHSHHIPKLKTRDEFGNKKCTVCKRYLPLSQFTKNTCRGDGLEAFCKDCNVIKARQWRQKNPERTNEIAYKSRRKHPDRANARSLAHYHYPIRQPCSFNGCPKLGERHIPDYSKPYEIIWLCREHYYASVARNKLVASVI